MGGRDAAVENLGAACDKDSAMQCAINKAHGDARGAMIQWMKA